jgi:methionyl-tRNA formyltransferase
LRIVFAGTPEFAVPCLRACARHGEVVAAYTQPDRPAGRGRGLQPSPVKLEAVQRGIPVHQPENFRSAASKAELRALQPDLMVVVAYGLLLPQSVLDIPPRMAAGTCTPRCCRAGAARRRSSARSKPATIAPASA